MTIIIVTVDTTYIDNGSRIFGLYLKFYTKY